MDSAVGDVDGEVNRNCVGSCDLEGTDSRSHRAWNRWKLTRAWRDDRYLDRGIAIVRPQRDPARRIRPAQGESRAHLLRRGRSSIDQIVAERGILLDQLLKLLA